MFAIVQWEALAEEYKKKVLMMKATQPFTKRVIINDTDIDSDKVIITVDLQDIGMCELLIPIARFDPFASMLRIESLPSDEREVNNAAYLKYSSELKTHQLMMLM